jgi:hypothetical protein
MQGFSPTPENRWCIRLFTYTRKPLVCKAFQSFQKTGRKKVIRDAIPITIATGISNIGHHPIIGVSHYLLGSVVITGIV